MLKQIYFTCAGLLLLSGCSQYDIAINDRMIYEAPKVLNADFIVDQALRECVQQQLIDAEIANAAGLTQLNCSSAGIEQLDGLEQFSNLEKLKLSGNRIRNLLSIAPLSSLQSLWLDNNLVVDAVPLTKIPNLEQLDLQGNSTLQCSGLSRFNQAVSVTAPDHCL